MHRLHMFRVRFSRAGGQLLLLILLPFLETLLSSLPPPSSDGRYYLNLGGREVCLCVCAFVVSAGSCWDTPVRGPDRGLKGNFNPVEISPLGRVSSDQFSIIYQSTNWSEAPVGRTPSCFLSLMPVIGFGLSHSGGLHLRSLDRFLSLLFWHVSRRKRCQVGVYGLNAMQCHMGGVKFRDSRRRMSQRVFKILFSGVLTLDINSVIKHLF